MPEYDLSTPDFHPDHRPVVVGDRPCIACGYNLSGLPVSGICPECGKPVQLSLLGELLQFASPEYIKSIDLGLKLLIAAIYTYLGLILVNLAMHMSVAGMTGPRSRGFTGAI